MKKRIPAFLAMTLILAAGAAPAAELEWHIKSEHPNQVSVEFYSDDRNHVWPGDNQVWIIDDWEQHDYTLSCNYGEKICFGAWVRNRTDEYWGAGYDGKQSCDSCCYVCGYGDTDLQVLKP